MADILTQIGTKVGGELKNLDTRLTSAETEIVALGGQTPPPTGSFTISPIVWTNLTEINLSGEKAQNISFDPPPLGLGVEVEVLASWTNGGKTASVGEIYEIVLVQDTARRKPTVQACEDCSREMQVEAVYRKNDREETERREEAIANRKELRGEVPDRWLNLPLTDAHARELGQTLFFRGNHCLRGHLAPYRINGGCLACAGQSPSAKDLPSTTPKGS